MCRSNGTETSENEVRRAYDELEQRVEERTAELARANEKLQLEIAERARRTIANGKAADGDQYHAQGPGLERTGADRAPRCRVHGVRAGGSCAQAKTRRLPGLDLLGVRIICFCPVCNRLNTVELPVYVPGGLPASLVDRDRCIRSLGNAGPSSAAACEIRRSVRQAGEYCRGVLRLDQPLGDSGAQAGHRHALFRALAL